VPILAKPNYQYQKRQRDLAKRKKQDEKRRRKLEKKDTTLPEGEAPPVADIPPPPETLGN
jgi:hypothetical protein